MMIIIINVYLFIYALLTTGNLLNIVYASYEWKKEKIKQRNDVAWYLVLVQSYYAAIYFGALY